MNNDFRSFPILEEEIGRGMVSSSLKENKQLEKNMETLSKLNMERDAAILENKESLEQQNYLLKENNESLRKLYENELEKSIKSAKEARKNAIFGWVSLALGTITSILIAIFK